jgi:hypothetical protein
MIYFKFIWYYYLIIHMNQCLQIGNIHSVKRSNESKVNESSDSNVPERHLCLNCNWILFINFFLFPWVWLCCCKTFSFLFYERAGAIVITFSFSSDLLGNDLVCKHGNRVRTSAEKKEITCIIHTYLHSLFLFLHTYICTQIIILSSKCVCSNIHLTHTYLHILFFLVLFFYMCITFNKIVHIVRVCTSIFWQNQSSSSFFRALGSRL